jgi:hypothetical protein
MLARRFDRAEETIRRHELEDRWAGLRGLESDGVEVPNLDRADAAEVFGAAGMLDDLARSLDQATPEVWLETVRGLPDTEDVDTVKARLAAMHFARAVAAGAVASLEGDEDGEGPTRPGERSLDPIETSLRWWGLLLERNTISGLAGGLRRLEQSIGRRIENLSPRRLRAGLDLLLRATADAVRNFDPSRQVVGHDLDRAVGLVVARRIAASPIALPMSGAGLRRIPSERMPVDPTSVIPRRTRDLLAPERWWRVVLAAERDEEIRRSVGWRPLARRFAFETPARPGTLSDVARAVGLPATRLVADMESSLADLRRVAMEEVALRDR